MASDDPLPVEQVQVVPGREVQQHVAQHQVGATGHPVGPVVVRDPHGLGEASTVGGRVRGAFTEAEEVAVRRSTPAGPLLVPGRGAETEMRPTHGGDPVAHPQKVADRMEGDLLIVGADLEAEIDRDAARVELVTREDRQRSQRLGAALGQPEPVDAVGPEHSEAGSERDRESGRRPVVDLTGVDGRKPRARRPLPHLLASREARGGLAPTIEQRAQFGHPAGDIDTDDHGVGLSRGGDARLVRAVELDRSRTTECVAVGRRRPAGHSRGGDGAGDGEPADRGGTGPCPSQDTPTTDGLHGCSVAPDRPLGWAPGDRPRQLRARRPSPVAATAAPVAARRAARLRSWVPPTAPRPWSTTVANTRPPT